MDAFPHHYRVSAAASQEGSLQLSSDTLPTIDAAPPLEFGGPGDKWSPETLLTSAAAACFILSFRAVAAASKFEYTSIECETEGELDRVDKITRFTRLKTHARLTVSDQAAKEKAQKLLEKAESICLIANSLNVERELSCEVIVA